MRAGAVIVPLDLRMATDVHPAHRQSAGAQWLAIGTGLDAPDPGSRAASSISTSGPSSGSRPRRSTRTRPAPTRAATTSRSRPTGSSRSTTGQSPTRDDLFEVIYTSGTTGVPKGVMLLHGTVLATLEAIAKILPPREHRAVSLLPPRHLFEQAPVLMFGTMIGAHILFVRSRTPRVIFEALREERVTTMVLVPQLLELFWLGLEREVKRQGREKTFNRARRIARHLPYSCAPPHLPPRPRAARWRSST